MREALFAFWGRLAAILATINRRLLEPIGNIPPAEAEELYYVMLEQSGMAVNSTLILMSERKPKLP